MQVKQISSKIITISFLTISIISFISVIFPKFLVEISINDRYRTVNFFDTVGTLTYEIIIVNVIFFGILILYKKNKYLSKFKKIFPKILDNDVSKRNAFVIIFVLFIIYFIFTFDEFFREEFELGDYFGVKEQFTKEYVLEENLGQYFVRYSLLWISANVFENVRIIPYIASIGLLLTTYFLTLELTKKRISGLIAFTILLQSNLFLLFDTTSSYENFWTCFYFISLYMILKKPIGSPVSFILSLLSKPLVITLLPINIYMILTKKIRNKKFLIITYGVIIVLITISVTSTNLFISNVELDLDKFTYGLNEFGNSLRFDNIILLLFFPATIFLIIRFRKTKDIINVNIILIGIIFTLLSQPILLAMADFSIQPYRFIPFIVFTSIAIGMTFMNPKKED